MHLRLQHITKIFPGVKALDDVSLDILPGEVHAICGENGAGKSTLMHLIAGNLRPDEGSLFLDDQPVTFLRHRDAMEKRIGIVYQERSLSASLSVAENIFPDHQPRNRLGFIHFKKLYEQAKTLLQQLGLPDIIPSVPAGTLPPARQQMLEIARALALKPNLLILDEPTASLTQQETDILFRIIRELRQSDVSVIYISHRMAEIKAIADRITVLKDGKCQGTYPAAEIDDEALIRLMVGRELKKGHYGSSAGKEVALELQGLSGDKFTNISLQLHRGEIFGLAGLIGAGRSELARAIFGAAQVSEGTIRLHGTAVLIRNPGEAVRNGIAYLPEERKSQAIFPRLSVAENVLASSLDRLATKGFIDKKAARGLFDRYKARLNIKISSPDQEIQTLSGGNQQKVILARCLSQDPAILIADEPTHGVDIGAKAEIYDHLKQLAAMGKSILLISSELSELMVLCDRIGVMRMGSLQTILQKEDATEEALMRYAAL